VWFILKPPTAAAGDYIFHPIKKSTTLIEEQQLAICSIQRLSLRV
jgi:hypothetical protein